MDESTEIDQDWDRIYKKEQDWYSGELERFKK